MTGRLEDPGGATATRFAGARDVAGRYLPARAGTPAGRSERAAGRSTAASSVDGRVADLGGATRARADPPACDRSDDPAVAGSARCAGDVLTEGALGPDASLEAVFGAAFADERFFALAEAALGADASLEVDFGDVFADERFFALADDGAFASSPAPLGGLAATARRSP